MGWYRSLDQKVFLGLAGGLAHKLRKEPTQVRICFVISLLFGVGALYILGWFLPALPTRKVPTIGKDSFSEKDK